MSPRAHDSRAVPHDAGLALVFDNDGFLVDPAAWTREAARQIATTDGIGRLTPDHWAIIFDLRERYLKMGTLPVMSHICRVHHLKRGAVNELFGGCRRAWRIAGLPNPGEEAKTYMS
ncbi:MAG: TusE/DsrC/DsvC family sulfur relay protein [Gammaproteobacteria bacterium]|jgi:tRNA 2-thiouridine synthesizing protein E